jgi:carbonic anhydrase
MQRTTPTTLLLFILLLPASAQAAKWISIGTKDQARIEVDSTSKNVPGEGKVRIWHRESYSKPTIPDSGAFSFSRLTTLSEFHCDKRLAATLQQSYSAADESELKTETFDSRDVQPVKPDSNLEMVLNYACRRPKPVVVAAPPEPPPPPPPPEPPKKSKGGKKVQEDLPPPPPPLWTYAGNTGPDKWGSLGYQYATCSLGKRQSPIDIRRTVKADLASIKFAYKAVPLSIVDNGHSIRVDTPDAGSMLIDGESYELVQLDFHKPSEEKINGKVYEMSAQLTHQSKSGKLAVLVILFEAGKEQGLIRTLWTHLPLEQEKPVTRADIKIDPTLLLPAKQNYIAFQGSLTTPPCTEGVLWLILKTPIQLSKEQLSSFASVYKNNVRPVQPSNNRVIKESR